MIEKKLNKSIRSVGPPMALALFCALFFWNVLWLPADQIIADNDLTNMFLRWLQFATSSLSQGELPLWNPYLFSGIPFIANPQPALFYPPTWLAFLFPATKALGWMIILHVLLAGASMITWLRAEGATRAGALIGGVTFAFSGYTFTRIYAGHLGVIATGAWLPLILWAYRAAIRRNVWPSALLAGVPVGLALLAGHSATFVYVALALGGYAFFHIWRRWRVDRSTRAALRSLGTLGVMVAVGLALATVQLLPLAELAIRSSRQAAPTYDFASRFSWPPGYLLTLLIPNFFGEPAQTGYWGDGIYDELIIYVGILPLLLTLLGARLKHHLKPFLITLGLGALLLAFGQNVALHRLFYRFVPLFRNTRAPARAGFLFTLAASALAGTTATALQRRQDDEWRGLLTPLNRSLTITVSGIAALIIVGGFMAFAWGRDSNPAAGRLWHLANNTALFLLFFLLAVGLLRAWRRRPSAGMWALALGLILLDLWTFGGGIVSPVPVPESAYWRTVAQAVDDPQQTRVLPWGLNDVQQNNGMPYGLRSIFGYDPLILQRYQTFIASRVDPLARTYDLLNAGYLVTPGPEDFPDAPDAPKLVAEGGGAIVYRRPSALPRAWIATQIEVLDESAILNRIHALDFDPAQTALVEAPLACPSTAEPEVAITHYGNNRIEAETEGAGLLIFSEIDYPGWQATVDGQPASLIRADYLLRAVCVPPGSHRVTLTYEPLSLKIGLAVTGATLVLIGVAAAGAIRRRRAAR